MDDCCSSLLPPASARAHHHSHSSPDQDQASSNNSLSDISSSFFDQDYDWASLQQPQRSNADSSTELLNSSTLISQSQQTLDQFGGFNLNFLIASSRPYGQQYETAVPCFQMVSPAMQVKPLKSLKRESLDQSTLVNCEDNSPGSARSGVFNPNCSELEQRQPFTAASDLISNKRQCLDQRLQGWSSPTNESKHKLSSVNFAGPALNTNGKPRAKRGSATDPQSVYARHRRERINERLKTLQHLVPNGAKVDIVTMLEEAIHYVKFLQLQVNMLSSDEYWTYAPTTYNGPETPLGLKLPLTGS
ncbi:hypothetical protein SELMODRAFT_404767 [Selaginella moellendorffii]|uniref:BHLH domain-containing protein n=1 Tax=Selaginella moellendorffii TaxID=88036 RepID=D8QWB7_SELML|nr:hypothetical protein SELMODRAFT_404767 [Selaginella moellendorffii]